MKKKERVAYLNSTMEELHKHLTNTESALVHWSIDRHTKQMKNSREKSNMKKKIAVLKTFIRQKELAHGA